MSQENFNYVDNTSKNMDKQNLATFINAKNKTLPLKRQHYFFYDSFARSDSLTDLGNGETNNTPYSYLTAGTGITWGIQGNSAYISSMGTSAGRSLAFQETNESDCILEVDLKNIAVNNGLAFRISDVNNFIYCVVQPTYFAVVKYVSGTASTITSISKNFYDGKLTIVLKGNRVEIYLDGFLVTKFYESFNATATKHGLYARGENQTCRYDNFCVKPVDNVPLRVTEDFENGLTKWYWGKETAGLSYSQTFSTSVKESGTQSLRIELHKDDPDVSNSKRCEIVLPSEQPLEEHWYGVSIYLPKGGVEDYGFDSQPEILMQWHGTPDTNEQNVSPPLSLQTVNGNYNIVTNSDAGRMSTGVPWTLTQTIANLGSYEPDKGRWVQWAFHVRWGYLASQNPITEVYKDGILVYQNNGIANMTNDQIGVYGKIGIYKWPWHDPTAISSVTSRVVYYDNFWML